MNGWQQEIKLKIAMLNVNGFKDKAKTKIKMKINTYIYIKETKFLHCSNLKKPNFYTVQT